MRPRWRQPASATSTTPRSPPRQRNAQGAGGKRYTRALEPHALALLAPGAPPLEITLSLRIVALPPAAAPGACCCGGEGVVSAGGAGGRVSAVVTAGEAQVLEDDEEEEDGGWGASWSRTAWERALLPGRLGCGASGSGGAVASTLRPARCGRLTRRTRPNGRSPRPAPGAVPLSPPAPLETLVVDAPLPISAHELFDLLFGCDSAFMAAHWAAEVRRSEG